MKRLDELSFYEVLEISPRATQGEIREAYERAKRIYTRDSIAIYSLLDENEIEEMCRLIEKAYETIGNEKRRREYDRMLGGVELEEIVQHAPPEHPFQPDTPLPTPNSRDLDPDCQKRVREIVARSGFEYTGSGLREIRETLGLDLREISTRTKVSRTNLEFIETEDFNRLPALVYLKGFVTEYAKCLDLETSRVVEEYLSRYRRWQEQKKTDERDTL